MRIKEHFSNVLFNATPIDNRQFIFIFPSRLFGLVFATLFMIAIIGDFSYCSDQDILNTTHDNVLPQNEADGRDCLHSVDTGCTNDMVNYIIFAKKSHGDCGSTPEGVIKIFIYDLDAHALRCASRENDYNDAIKDIISSHVLLWSFRMYNDDIHDESLHIAHIVNGMLEYDNAKDYQEFINIKMIMGINEKYDLFKWEPVKCNHECLTLLGEYIDYNARQEKFYTMDTSTGNIRAHNEYVEALSNVEFLNDSTVIYSGIEGKRQKKFQLQTGLGKNRTYNTLWTINLSTGEKRKYSPTKVRKGVSDISDNGVYLVYERGEYDLCRNVQDGTREEVFRSFCQELRESKKSPVKLACDSMVIDNQGNIYYIESIKRDGRIEQWISRISFDKQVSEQKLRLEDRTYIRDTTGSIKYFT